VTIAAIPDIPEQGLEPWRKKALCANCPFSGTDQDDGKLYCYEDSPKAQAIVGERKLATLMARSGPAPQNGGLEVLGIVTYFPQVQPQWSCWKHPARQQERRKLESAL
jgi:hypothetical protein